MQTQHSCLRGLRETHCLPNDVTAFWAMGLCEEAFALRELSNITRDLCTGLITSPGSLHSIRSTGAPDGHQLGKSTELHAS